jgi:hypothetical protein
VVSVVDDVGALAALVLAPAADVVAIEVDDGTLLVDEATGRTFPLNATGALLWSCLDGESALGEIGHDLAEGFGVDDEVIAGDVEPLVRRLLDLRLIEAPGHGIDVPELQFTDECCSHGTFAVHPVDEPHVHRLVHAGVWLEEPADSCRDGRYLLGPQGNVVARLRLEDGSERLVGLRTNDLAAAATLRERLGPQLAADEPFGFPNISLLIGRQRGHARDVNIVVRRGVRVFHTFSLDEAVDAALALVPTFLPPPDGFVPLHVRALARDGALTLVADLFAEVLDAQRRRLRGAGYDWLPQSPVLVDPRTGLARLAPDDTPRPIAQLVVTGEQSHGSGCTSFDLARLTPLVSSGGRPLRVDDVRALAELARRVPVVWVDAVDRRRLADALLAR